MADEVVVTELTIDARGAEAGSAAYVKAMKSAQAAYDKAMDSANAATEAVAKQTTVMTGGANSITSTARAWDRFKASVDPAFQATQRMERALLTADAAAKKLGVDQNEINRVMDLARVKHLGTAVAVEEGARAATMGATQWASLGHAARSAAESIAMGQSPMMVMTQQANHLSYAMSGPQGLIAASAGVRAAFGTWLTTIPGMLSTAGVAAVAAVAVYMAATREKILSVDEILEGHKKLLDEVANTYPHLTEALKKYADEAAKLPGSVIAADAKTQIENDQRSLAASLDHLKVDLRDLARASDVVGTSGAEAFGKIADTIDAGNVNVDKLVASVGDLRLDPSLTPDAHHFADGLQAAVNEVKKLQDILDKDQGIKRIGPDGQKATQTLAEVSAGFKDVSAKAGTADATIAKLFGDASASSGFGVSKSLQSTLGQFEQIDQAVQHARQDQLQGMLSLEQQYRNTTTQVDTLKQAIATAGSKENMAAFFDDTSKIKDASADITSATSTVTKLFDALNRGGTSVQNVYAGLDMVRQTLIRDGFGVDAVNKFIDSLVRTRMQLDADTAGAKQLGAAVQALKDKTVTITVVTQQVGTGTKSIYDVPGGPVGVTRYGGDGNPSFTQQSYQVPSGSGTSGVTVTRFGGTRAAGGPVSASTPYWVGEHGPELVVPQNAGTVIPNAQSMALANPQSAFTGREATREQDRIWTVLLNIEANTRKTYEGVDKWGVSSTYSSGGSSSGSTGTMTKVGGDLYDSNGLNAAGHTAAQVAAFRDILTSAMSNYSAIGGMGLIGYGANALAATPQQIAYNLAYGGGQSVGIPANSRVGPSAPTALHGGDPYNAMLNGISPSSPGYAAAYAQALAASNKAAGFSTGGMIGGDSRDTQKVEFFKRPSERVIIADNDQLDDQRSGGVRSGGGSQRPIQFSQTNHWNGNAPPSKDSLAAVRRATALGFQDAQRSQYGR